jgi:hypothetical protein
MGPCWVIPAKDSRSTTDNFRGAGQLGRPQTPGISLEIGRRLKAFERTFAPIGTDAAHQEWGLWWLLPRKELAGRSPIEVLKAGDTLDLEALTAPTMELALFAMELGYWKQI